MRWDRYGGGWPEYVPVGARIARAAKAAVKRATKAGRQPEPVKITGRAIATTFWGQSWCRNLECYSDFANRLPRGRTYARNGSVVDLVLESGRINAVVAGSLVYDVAITIAPLPAATWRAIKTDCAGSIDTLVDLLSGRLADDVMRRLARPGDGMFPGPREVKVRCSCPDGARLCKHLAAVLYAIGNRLDTRPELLFLLRGVDQTELVAAATKDSVARAVRGDAAHALADDDLAGIFGIEMGAAAELHPARATKPTKPTTKSTTKQKARLTAEQLTKPNPKSKATSKSRRATKPVPVAKPTPAKPKPKPKPAKSQPAKARRQPAERSTRQPRER